MGLYKMPSLKLILHLAGKDATEGYIYLRAGIPGTRRYVPKALGRRVPVKYWDKDNEIVTIGFPEYRRFNDLNKAQKDTVQARFDADYKAGVQFTEDHIRSVMFPESKSEDFIAFFRDYIDLLIETRKKAPATIAVFETQYEEFRKFAGDYVPFSRVTVNLLNDYHKYLVRYRDSAVPRGYAATTIHKKLKKTRQVIANAAERGLIDKRGLVGFDMVRYEAPTKDRLTLEQVELLMDRLLAGKYDDTPTLRLVCAFFLIECLSGIRFSDWHRFKIEKLLHADNFSLLSTTKNDKQVILPLTKFRRLARVVYYIRDNHLSFSLSEQKTNTNVKLLIAGIGLHLEVTTHTGRRTCATLWGEAGYTTRWIARAMGVTERTAAGYIETTSRALENEIEKNGGL